MCNNFFIHSSVDGQLGCFHVLAVVNSAAMNIGVHVSFQIMVFSGYMPRSGIAGSYGSSIFSVLGFFPEVFFYYLFIYLFIYGCVGSLFLYEGFLYLQQAGSTLHRGARASHCRSLSCCGAQAPDVQAEQLWLTDLVAPWHVGSSQTRARTCVPSIGRQILNHCATREALFLVF